MHGCVLLNMGFVQIVHEIPVSIDRRGHNVTVTDHHRAMALMTLRSLSNLKCLLQVPGITPGGIVHLWSLVVPFTHVEINC